MKNKEFSIKNYLDMYKARGIRLVIEYFFYNHLFDIINKTDTHSWSNNNSYDPDLGVYMASWNKDVLAAMKLLENKNQRFVNSADFIDIGSGKGKVLLFWRKKYGEKKKIIGIEYNKDLIKICKLNFRKLKFKYPQLVSKDARKVALKKENNKKIFYLYNPFNLETLRIFFLKNSFKYSAIIYFNPLHSNELLNLNYECIYTKSSYRNGSSFKVYISRDLKKILK